MSEHVLEIIAKNIKTKSPILNLEGCDLTYLPEEIRKCVWLKVLNLGKNYDLTNISPISTLLNIEELDCNGTKVSDLSPLVKLMNLRLLNFNYTEISNLSPLKSLVNLEEILCYATRVSDLTPLSNLRKLQVFNCSSTQINDLAPLSNLTDLRSLFCEFTQITDLSPISNLTNLKALNCNGTQVFDLSPLLHLARGGVPIKWEEESTGVSVFSCPLTSPPPEIVKQGNEAILRYFDEREKYGTDQIYEAKLLIIGEGGAGKTTFCHKLFNAEAELPKEKDSTQGIDVRPFYFDMPAGKRFRLNVWDFAGQGKYQAAHGVHFKLSLRQPELSGFG